MAEMVYRPDDPFRKDWDSPDVWTARLSKEMQRSSEAEDRRISAAKRLEQQQKEREQYLAFPKTITENDHRAEISSQGEFSLRGCLVVVAVAIAGICVIGLIGAIFTRDEVPYWQKDNSSAPLYEAKVYDLYWGALRSIHDVPENQRELVNGQFNRLRESGQQVIECQYGPSDPKRQEGFQTWQFWYGKEPPNIDDMIRSVPVGTHPMRTLGRIAIAECPESPALALKVRQSSFYP